MTGEFEHIDSMIEVLGETTAGTGVVLGPGDDAAVLAMPAGHELVVSTDTLVAERHYPPNARADSIGYRSMAVATSDLAAMGATPGWATVSLVTPTLSRDWATLFAAGIKRAALDFELKVVGGNLARGPQSVSVTVHGHVPAGQAIQRSGAKAGDGVYVTGALGGAGSALADAGLASASLPALAADSPLRRYWKPTPRLKLAISLRTVATAAIDISDGLAADLTHLCNASAICCDVDLDDVPLFPGVAALQAVAAGDDYELAFTASPACEARLHALATRAGVPVSRIGTAYAGSPPVARWFSQGNAIQAPMGYRHF